MTLKENKFSISCWYHLAEKAEQELDCRPDGEVKEEYQALLTQSEKLRFHSDVLVGINLSGGLDSSILLGTVGAVFNQQKSLNALTFITEVPKYDELFWVQQMLFQTQYQGVVSPLQTKDVPDLAQSVQSFQDEPFGGFPTTLADAKLF